jgi:hypothetical protein
MQFEELWKIVSRDLKSKLEQNQGLAVFAKNRAKFEGWLKVELCDNLTRFVDDITPERDRIDVTFKGWAIELKTINTTYRVSNFVSKHKPLLKNIRGILKDIEKLKLSTYLNKAVLFVVFPVNHEQDKRWQAQLKKVSPKLKNLKQAPFKFQNEVEGYIYLGLL